MLFLHLVYQVLHSTFYKLFETKTSFGHTIRPRSRREGAPSMESYGAELKETPYPLVAALGARELQARVLPLLRSLNEEFVPKVHFAALAREHRFPSKKEVREKHGPFPNQSQRDLDGYRVGGVLKARWLKKHHELLPAVALLFHDFDPRWSQKDWLAHESALRDDMDQLRRELAGAFVHSEGSKDREGERFTSGQQRASVACCSCSCSRWTTPAWRL